MAADNFNYSDSIVAGVRLPRLAGDSFRQWSKVEIEVRDKYGKLKSRGYGENLRVNGGADFWDFGLLAVSKTLTGTNTITSVAAASGTGGPASTATTVYTGTFTNGGSNAYVGYLITLTGGTTVANNGTYLCTASTATTITLANPNGAAQSTGTLPTVQTAVTNAGQANWIALSTDTVAPAATDTTLAAEQTTNGLARAQGTDAHTAGASSSQFTHTWTYTGAVSVVIAKVGLFLASTGSPMVLETLLAATATVNANGDQINLTWTINF